MESGGSKEASVSGDACPWQAHSVWARVKARATMICFNNTGGFKEQQLDSEQCKNFAPISSSAPEF